jgi:hypothetical protein
MPGLFDDVEDEAALELLERMADALDEVLEALERIEDRLPDTAEESE